ncbi:iron ABC transporter permease [Psychromonas sp. SR45-3]|uniref:FecCD family ABC transporter permease n=1 Tax=Psychromonas sp. SR45-3 TaxID=2760930 RepID=UPI0015F853EE|nr:iron ABC transporter permease [Psychromonas sp. SR45-3]MBB1272304.1 iron ABC transporter permease [Psychromonas sp. SR45-3]
MKRQQWLGATGISLMCLLLIVALVIHLSIGTKVISISDILHSFYTYNEDNFDHLIIQELRLPRAMIAICVGACLAVAGALMQGVTRNPLADPSLLGMMTGGALAVVYWSTFVTNASLIWLPVVAAVGALISAIIVWNIAARTHGGITPLSLILSGAAFTAFSGALLAIHHLLDEQTFEEMRTWLVGSLLASNIETLYWCIPWIVVGLIGAIVLAPSVTALSMGEEIATGLGINIRRRKWQLLVCIVILTSAAIALAGPLGFIGLVIPHVVRFIVGADYRWIIPYSILLGAVYLLSIDSLARWLIQPQEIATGLITILMGAPLFIWLVKVKVR